MFLLRTFNTMTIQVVSFAELLFNIKIFYQPGPHKKVQGLSLWVKRRVVDWLLCNPKAYCRSHSSKQIRVLLLPNEMSKGLNVNWCNSCKHKVHIISVSTCSDRAISSGHAGHYFTVLWCSEGNLREARGWLWLTLEEGKSRSKGVFFLYLTSERKQ